MRIIDLTRTITEDMQVYPGTEPPKLGEGSTIERDGFKETALFMCSHTGTHMDAPAHMLKNGATLDGMPAGAFMGKAAVIPSEGVIDMGCISPYMDMAGEADFLIFHTGQEHLWGREEYLYAPVPDEAVIKYAISTGKKGVGVDCMSVDPVSGPMSNHIALFEAGLVIVENLCNLDVISGRTVEFIALPLKYRDAEGAPVRAVAIFEE